MIKKLILLGFGLTLLIGLPLAIFVLQNQSQTTTSSGAAPVTRFTFSGPTTGNVGDKLNEDVVVDPGSTNQVSFVKFTFTYDPNFIDKVGATPSDVVSIEQPKYTVLQGPTITCATLCTVSATLSIGNNQTAVIKSPTHVATVHLTAKANTDANGTQLAFVGGSGQNEALSVAPSDQAAENVYQTGIPSTIIIGNQTPTTTITPTTTTTLTPTTTLNTINTTTGTGTNNGAGVVGPNGQTVACSSFTANPVSGNSPLAVTFTTVGASPNDSISQLVVTYGDGNSDTVASGSGIGTGDVNNQISHTYANNGIFTASAVFTTTSGATSDPSTCTKTVTVGQQTAQASVSPTGLPPTGPGETFVLVGGIGALVSVIGAIVVFGL